MLRLTPDTTNRIRPVMRAEGRLVGEWVSLLEMECARLLGNSTRLELDLADVTDVDAQGITALRRLRRGPVVLTGCTPIILALLSEEMVP